MTNQVVPRSPPVCVHSSHPGSARPWERGGELACLSHCRRRPVSAAVPSSASTHGPPEPGSAFPGFRVLCPVFASLLLPSPCFHPSQAHFLLDSTPKPPHARAGASNRSFVSDRRVGESRPTLLSDSPKSRTGCLSLQPFPASCGTPLVLHPRPVSALCCLPPVLAPHPPPGSAKVPSLTATP